MAAFADSHFGTFLRYERGIKSYMSLKFKPPIKNSRTFVFFGRPGCGKTFHAIKCGAGDFYPKNPGPWWDNYTDQGTLIMDDFRGGWMPFHDLLHICDPIDGMPLLLGTKGSHVYAQWNTVILTTNYLPDSWYSKEKYAVNIEAFIRRVDTWYLFVDKITYSYREFSNFNAFWEVAKDYQ